MFNSIKVYRDAGRKAGRASKNRDASLVSHWRYWMTRALALETEADRKIAQQAYNEAYAEEATPSRSYFK
jgi:hypothetical protein